MKFRKIFFLAVGIGVVFALSSCNKKKQNHINLASNGADGPTAIYIATTSSTLAYPSYLYLIQYKIAHYFHSVLLKTKLSLLYLYEYLKKK